MQILVVSWVKYKPYRYGEHACKYDNSKVYLTKITCDDQSTWEWSYDITSTAVADVAYDLFTSTSPNGDNINEIMVWLANINAGPISAVFNAEGQAVPAISNVELEGNTWLTLTFLCEFWVLSTDGTSFLGIYSPEVTARTMFSHSYLLMVLSSTISTPTSTPFWRYATMNMHEQGRKMIEPMIVPNWRGRVPRYTISQDGTRGNRSYVWYGDTDNVSLHAS